MSVQNTSNADSCSSLYQQLPLREFEIRLLRLDLLDIHNGSTPYKALSYTWGEASVTKDIVINGIKFPVTANLYAFLENQQKEGEDVELWIDAICINQNDLLEKNHQIPMMNIIYAAARALIIWLGQSSSDSDLALEWILYLGKSSPYDKMPNIPNDAWQAMQSLLERPWWKRIWIVQELATGAMSTKLDQVHIHCGCRRLSWINVVVAAARMKAYQDDKRQAFPTIAEILELDSLRDSAANYFLHQPKPKALFDLICRYRHFLATNRRDKIYAIWNMFARAPSSRLKTRYDQSVEEVYVDFAAELLSGEPGLEVLRQCGNGSLDIPSWAPDWSAPLGSLPLPFRYIQRYFDVPWWAEPEHVKPRAPISADGNCEPSRVTYSVSPPMRDPKDERSRERRIKRLEMAANGSAVIKDLKDIPENFTFHSQCTPEVREQLEGLLQREDFVLVVGNENPQLPEHPDAIQQGELVTERHMKKWLLQELHHSTAEPLYATATMASADFVANKTEKSLKVKGILWDELEVCHESFVEDVDTDLADTTRFMVAVGCCKHLAMSTKSATTKYPDVSELLEAFWSTLFVGQIVEKQEGNDAQSRPRYEEWLPEIPKSWSPGQPPVAARTTGLIGIAEMYEAMKDPTFIFNTKHEDGSPQFIHYIDPQIKELAFPPHDDDYVTLVHQLASMWHQQPYDLYHRPFDLLNVIPDPYWKSRQDKDELAKKQSSNRHSSYIKSEVDIDTLPVDREFLHKAYSQLDEHIKQRPSLVPQDTLPAGIEKYALGRRFFITKKGYFGLGPQKSEPGDRIVVLFGSGVPFVLRKCTTVAGKGAWRIVGECYVHGIMQGEVVKKWELGSAETRTILVV
ncbi:hypothetical protein TARUN_3273 [Trichoderma arundinaceum]|uniref:Heterokaryon incompatibility domain-containing protein n=1 Tax=Trichoderma arundinaceum TaxID=490622 RepID=A0A395NSG0_TRIAR|nr:hypothetical protein TARUN_3273 [Trichoderma arundinaceum]